MGSGKRQIPNGKTPVEKQIQKFRETTSDSAQPAKFGTLDVNSVPGNPEKPSCYVQYKGQEWIKFDNDTGAVTTVPLVQLAEDHPLREVGGFIVANCEDTPNFGQAMSCSIRVWQHTQDGRTMSQKYTKPLVSASAISKYHDAFIFEEFGAIVPRHSRVAAGLRREYHRFCQIRGYIMEFYLCIEKEYFTNTH